MKDIEIWITIASLLHDIGKVLYRQGNDKRNHSQSGYDYLKNDIKIQNQEILDCVMYHHSGFLKGAKLKKDAIAYIVYIADNIASAADRRNKEIEDSGFEVSTPLQSVFNKLNGNNQNFYYGPYMLNTEEEINFPREEKIFFDKFFYSKVKANLTENLRGIEYSNEYINSLLEILEANLSYVPSSTSKREVADISLFDHVKLTAAVANCIYLYLEEQDVKDYKEELLNNSDGFYDKEAFFLYTMDVSGIQDFIYTTSSKNALKTLRARSFYLEIMMEHIIDCFLEKMKLSRTNLIYSGGGHCYILVPNTKSTLRQSDLYMEQLNTWLRETFDISLFVASGFSPCSCNALKNIPQGSYAKIFENSSKMLSKVKSARYTAEEILAMNGAKKEDYARECKVCKRISEVDVEGICSICKSIEYFSTKVLYGDFFSVILEKREQGLPLPGGYYLVADDKNSLKEKMQKDNFFVRSYSKNKMFSGKHIATKLWTGSFTSGKNFAEMASEAMGIGRIGILRADVDNLGHAFVAGFDNESNNNRYVTLSRTAALSRQLSLFFKLNINKIMGNPEFLIRGEKLPRRNATIVYSGGDDLFIVGAWNEIIELGIDIRRKFDEFTQGQLTISAGIGVYDASYPISVSAKEVEKLENNSKKKPGKAAITIFSDGNKHEEIVIEEKRKIAMDNGTYSWIEFEKEVLAEKYALIEEFFDNSDERGKNFLYNLLDLIRGSKEKINFARYVYILSRLEPSQEASAEQKDLYNKFSKNMYSWIKDEKACRQVKTAMNLYGYITREKGEL